MGHAVFSLPSVMQSVTLCVSCSGYPLVRHAMIISLCVMQGYPLVRHAISSSLCVMQWVPSRTPRNEYLFVSHAVGTLSYVMQ